MPEPSTWRRSYFFLYALAFSFEPTVRVFPALVLGLAGALGILVSGLTTSLQLRIPPRWRAGAVLGGAWLLFSGLRLLLAWLLPEFEKEFGLYISLLGFSPLVLFWVPATELAEPGRGLWFKLALAFAGWLILLAGVREILGTGRFSFGPQDPLVLFPEFWAFSWLQRPSAALALSAAAAYAVYQGPWLRAAAPKPASTPKVPKSPAPRPVPLPAVKPARTPPPAPAPKPEPVVSSVPEASADPVAAPVIAPDRGPDLPPKDPVPEAPVEEAAPTSPPRPLSSEPDADSLLRGRSGLLPVLRTLAETPSERKRRLMVFGMGTGEAVWRLAMDAAQVAQEFPAFQYRLRGLDAFAGRVETAREAVYKDSQWIDLPLEDKQRFLLKNTQAGETFVRFKDELRATVEFLAGDGFDEEIWFARPADLIVVEQGLAHLRPEKQSLLLGHFAQRLEKGGLLVLRQNHDQDLLGGAWQKEGEGLWRRL